LCGQPSLPLLREALRYRFLWHHGDYARILHNALLTFPSVYQLLPTPGGCATLDGVNMLDPLADGVLDVGLCQEASAIHAALRAAESRLVDHGGVFSIYTAKHHSKATPVTYEVEVRVDGLGSRYELKAIRSSNLGDGTVPAANAVLPSVIAHELIDVTHSFMCSSRYVARLIVQILSERFG